MAAAQRFSGPPGGALSALPDDVLERCLAGLSQEERCGLLAVAAAGAGAACPASCRAIPLRSFACRDLVDCTMRCSLNFALAYPRRLRSARLVSKRFHRLCAGPQLLRELCVRCTGLAAAESLALFMCKHGRHVRTLHATFTRGDDHPSDLAAAISVAITAAGAGGQLQELELEAGYSPQPPGSDCTTVLPAAWLPAVPSLRRLAIRSHSASSATRLPAHLLAALEWLHLDGRLAFAPGAALPTSVTNLRLGSAGDGDMPPQVRRGKGGGCRAPAPANQRLAFDPRQQAHRALTMQLAALTDLCRLELHRCEFSHSSIGLPRLSSLTRLAIAECRVPASLSALSQLRHLDLKEWGEEDEPGMDATLALLQQLTTLVLASSGSTSVPPSVGALAQLKRFNWWAWPSRAKLARLPPGPWLRSIRWLCAEAAGCGGARGRRAALALRLPPRRRHQLL